MVTIGKEWRTFGSGTCFSLPTVSRILQLQRKLYESIGSIPTWYCSHLILRRMGWIIYVACEGLRGTTWSVGSISGPPDKLYGSSTSYNLQLRRFKRIKSRPRTSTKWFEQLGTLASLQIIFSLHMTVCKLTYEINHSPYSIHFCLFSYLAIEREID